MFLADDIKWNEEHIKTRGEEKAIDRQHGCAARFPALRPSRADGRRVVERVPGDEVLRQALRGQRMPADVYRGPAAR